MKVDSLVLLLLNGEVYEAPPPATAILEFRHGWANLPASSTIAPDIYHCVSR